MHRGTDIQHRENPLRTNNAKFQIGEISESRLCSMCGSKNKKKHEIIWHLVGEYSKMAPTYYRRKHDFEAKFILVIMWKIQTDQTAKLVQTWILKDVKIHCDFLINARWPDIVLLDKIKEEIKKNRYQGMQA